MLLRDLADLARTHLMSDILREFCVVMEALWTWRKEDGEKPSADRLVQQIKIMGDLLFSHDDFSLTKSLARLASVHPLNPDSELTLKGNAEDRYCRSYIAELYPAVYVPEAEFYRDWIRNAERKDRENKEEFLAAARKIRDRFYRIPLARFVPKRKPGLARVLHALEKFETEKIPENSPCRQNNPS